MRKIIFHLSVGIAGMDATENGTYSDDVTDEQLNDDAWLLALQNAESYGYYPTEYIEEEDFSGLSEDEVEEVAQMYVDGIEGWWEDYDPEKHDGLACGEWKWNES